MKITIEVDVPEPKKITLDPARTIIVVIDLENEFCAPRGKKYLGPAAEEAVRASASFIDDARQWGVSVIWVQSVREVDAVEFTAFHQERHLIKGTWAVEYTPPLNVFPDEPILQKYCHDCFTGTALESYLANRGIVGPDWNVIVVGVALPVCVNHAVQGFSVRNYRVVLPLDCVAPREGAGAYATMWRYGIPAYSYNIVISRSDWIRFDGNPQ